MPVIDSWRSCAGTGTARRAARTRGERSTHSWMVCWRRRGRLMIDLDFRVENAVPAPFAAAPQVNFRLQIVAPADRVVHALTLRCLIQIEATRRRYTAVEQRRL